MTSVSGKKNLRRHVESKTGDFKFISHGNNLLVYPTSLKIVVIIANYDLRSKIKSLQQTSSKESIVTECQDNQGEIKNIDYKMPWPPGPDDLYMSNFINPKILDKFLTTLLESNSNAPPTDRVNRLKSSLGHDLTYAGKIFQIQICYKC